MSDADKKKLLGLHELVFAGITWTADHQMPQDMRDALAYVSGIGMGTLLRELKFQVME